MSFPFVFPAFALPVQGPDKKGCYLSLMLDQKSALSFFLLGHYRRNATFVPPDYTIEQFYTIALSMSSACMCNSRHEGK